MLDQDIADQRHIAEVIDKTLERTRSDNMKRTACFIGDGLVTETSTLIFSIVPDADYADEELEHLADYVTARKHQMQTTIGAGLIFDLMESDRPKGSCYDNRTPGSDPQLDQLVMTYGLLPEDEAGS